MDDNIIYGRIPVINALLSKSKPVRIFLKSSDERIEKLAKEKNVAIKRVTQAELDKLTDKSNHQGVCCSLPRFVYADLKTELSKIDSKKESTILILDGIEDPVNFGSMIRTSVAFGVDMIIIGKNRQVQVNGTVAKVATGSQVFIPIVQVANISQAIAELKKHQFWMVAAAGEGDSVYDEIDYSGKIGLIIGSEGFGISKLVRKNSDFIASIPMNNDVTALNASIACSIFLAQISSYRRHK